MQEEPDQPAIEKRSWRKKMMQKQPDSETGRQREVVVGQESAQRYQDNLVHTTKYTLITFLPKNIFEQFHRLANIYFLFIIFLNWVPALNSFDKEVSMLPLLLVLCATAIKDLYEDNQRRLSDLRVNRQTCRVYCQDRGDFQTRPWQEVRVGDLVLLSSGDLVPADMVLLHSTTPGRCYLETQNLDGETNLKLKEVPRGLQETSQLDGLRLEYNPPSSKLDTFLGSMFFPGQEKISLSTEHLLLRGCVLRNTLSIKGLVVYAGHDTKAMLNTGRPQGKRSKMEGQITRDLVWCMAILLLCCLVGAIGSGVWLQSFSQLAPFLSVLQISDVNPILTGFLAFWTFILILQIIIPISLYITIELAKLCQVYLIQHDPLLYDPVQQHGVTCRTFNITEDLGQVEVVLCDKTGTITENRMVFKCCTIHGKEYEHVVEEHQQNISVSLNYKLIAALSESSQRSTDPTTENSEDVEDFFLILAICNTVDVAGGATTTKEINLSTKYEAESQDELALVEAAAAHGIRLVHRSPGEVRVQLSCGTVRKYQVLEVLAFDSERRRMSVIVRREDTKEPRLLCKGADSSLGPLLRRPRSREEVQVQEATQRQVTEYSRTGLRSLVMAARDIKEEEYMVWRKRHVEAKNSLENREQLLRESCDSIEQDLELMGATGVEDRLQDSVSSTMSDLRRAGVSVWLVTGDSQGTAVSVAHSAGLFAEGWQVVMLNCETEEEARVSVRNHLGQARQRPSETRALVVDGQTLDLLASQPEGFLDLVRLCTSVLACRVTPLQKGQLARPAREGLGRLTLAIGDGANDVSMLQAANVGVGVYGQEGRQAVMAADFAIPSFSQLRRLLLVHGHWSYYRLASLVIHSFYKNASFVFVLFWYQFHNGFSGQVMIDQLHLVLFSVLYTSLPPLALGVCEQDFTSTKLLETQRFTTTADSHQSTRHPPSGPACWRPSTTPSWSST